METFIELLFKGVHAGACLDKLLCLLKRKMNGIEADNTQLGNIEES